MLILAASSVSLIIFITSIHWLYDKRINSFCQSIKTNFSVL
nr:MAG TPA: hypothetical protein [Caudoviricetes sp.]